jgi:hypothetical protein
MSFALIQLSDIHFRQNEAENPVLRRVDAIVSAARSVAHGVSAGVILNSGDTAFSGKKIEYEHARRFFERLKAGLGATFGQILLIAGNHDCDFARATSVRSILIGSLKPEQIDDAVVSQCIDPQREYFEFAHELEGADGDASKEYGHLYRQVAIRVADARIVFHLFNSAWLSQLHEKPGTLYYPIRIIKDRIALVEPAALVVSVIHHPFNWYVPENGRELRQCLEDSADLILTGHEHVSGAYSKKTDIGEQNEYLEGGVLQESGHPEVSSFNVVLFDIPAGQQQTHRFVWNAGCYAAEGEPYWRPFERNKRLTRNQFEFTDYFLRYLEDPGAGYTHAHKDPLLLSDVYVYPDLQEVKYQREAADRPMVPSREVMTYILNNGSVLIVAEEKAGKTSLAKRLLRDFHHNGRIPVLLDGELLGSSDDDLRLKRTVEERVNEQYGPGHIDTFWQLALDQRVVVVDDLHKAQGNRKSKEELVALLCSRFGVTVLLAGEEFRVEEITSASAEKSIIRDFKQCNMLPLGHALRHELVSKWCRLGREYSEDEPELQRMIRNAEEQISVVISKDFLPSFPVFILILLQQLEAASKVTTTAGSFGYLYEVLVTTSLSRKRGLRIDLDAKYNYLTELAHHLFRNKKRSLSEDDLRAWHHSYCADYKIAIDFGPIRDEFVDTGVIDSRHGEYRFRYKYLYYFFVGRYFRDHINEEDIQAQIKNLSQRLYHEESANIMIFLCHLSKDERVLRAMLDSAGRLFSDSPRFDIGGQTAFMSKLTADLPKLVLESGDTAKNREEMLKGKDQLERQATAASTGEESSHVPQPETEITPLLQYNAAFKTIQILGQVLKNFTGSLKGEPKRQLVEECYALGLRALGDIFKLAEEGLPDLVAALVEHAKSSARPPSEDKIEQYTYRLFFGLLNAVTFYVFKHVSDSVGTEKVAQTFAEVAGADANPSIKVIDLSIRLDHYRQFPQAQIDDLAKMFSNNPFAMSLIRYLVWYNLYLFPVEQDLKQRACQRLEISLGQQRKLLTGPKQTNVKRGRGSDRNLARKKKKAERKRRGK